MIKRVLTFRFIGDIVFGVVFVLLFFAFGLNETMFEPPQSVHMWRQTNCLSIAQNYYQDDLPFLEPQIHNQFCDGGYSGSAVGEFPIIYYTVAKFWKVFGNEVWIFRLVQLIIQFLGLYALFHSLQYLLKNWFWSAFASLLVFTSPMVVFYGLNFLPDVPGLSFVFLAWFMVFRYLKNRSLITLWISAVFFCLAMLLKVTSALSFIAFGGWVIFEILFLIKENRTFNFKLKHFVPFLATLPIVVAWYLYVEHYNGIHGGHFSFHGIWPVWDMSKEQFLRIIDALDKIYFKEIFLPYTQYLTFAIWLCMLFVIKSFKPIYRYFLIVLPAGFLIELMLWFQVLEGHDYYTINLLIVFVAVWAIFLKHLKQFKIYRNPIFYVVATAFFVFNVVTCSQRIQVRYTGWMNGMYEIMKPLIKIEPVFEALGIEATDKVISVPDFTINASLYYMNRKGYTDFSSDFNKVETFYERIEQGAKYLIINDSSIISKDQFKPFVTNKIGQFENILIYDIQDIKRPN